MAPGETGARKPKSEKTPLYRVIAFFVVPLMNLLARYDIQHSEHLPASGPAVVSPNHYSEIDPIVIGLAMWKRGRTPRFLAKASLFKVPVVGWILRKTGQIPVERRQRNTSDPLAAANKLTENGLAVVIYPEGTLTRDPDLWPMRGKHGAVRMALEHDVPLIPVAHWGTQAVLPRYGKRISFFPRKDISIRFGAPVDLTPFKGRPLDHATLNAATDKLMDAIAALLSELRGEPAPAERWDPSKAGQSETGRFD
ncbi:lysophospholipid acyltransferase family protein [Cryobacterium sp. BB307]|uniref:lysophospholipid acyltransferase family protein n=1 Tax=Cryobacterium sp. BB307 TaxID=2716317 RepID=UPI0032C01A11